MSERSPYHVTLQELVEHVLSLGGSVEIGIEEGAPYLCCSAIIHGSRHTDRINSSGDGSPARLAVAISSMVGYSAFNPEREDGFAPRR